MVSDTKTDSNTHTITISNLEEYIHEITKLGDHQNLYYRGQKDTFNNTLPSLFRNPKYLENENNLINDFITKNPELFVDCQNNFDRLALMQHHQLPTRLLDITNNSLVALYFAIEHGNEKKEPDGQIFLFQDSYNQDFLNFFLKKSNLNNINSEVTHKILRSAFSDQIDIESSLTRLNKEDREGFLNQLNIFYSSIDRHMENNNISWFNTYSDIRNNVDEKKIRHYWTLLQDYKYFNENISTQRLYHEIRKDIGEFQSQINPLEFLTPKIVVPRNIDQRIRNQNGVFMLVPFIDNNTQKNNGSLQHLTTDVYKNKIQKAIDILSLKDKGSDHKKVVFKIPGEKKSKIRNQLTKIGITESFIYPDSSHIANEIAQKYEG